MKTKNILFLLSFLLCAFIEISAQRILLDKPVRAGELILFPEVDDGSKYYYMADKPRLARHPNGDLQFSFIRYVKNELSDGSSTNSVIESNTGGGIVHALVELHVSDEQIEDAQRALRRVDGDGTIMGPVIYKSGTVSLISAVANPEGDMVETIVGLGSAPVLENQRAAVAVQLNQIGSKILWETFNTSTPDFSFNFEMEIEGYLSPKRALIEADFERVYKHQAFDAGATGTMGPAVMSAEISTAFDDLKDAGAIKVTQIGSDEKLDELMQVAYTQLTNLMFDKIGGTGVPQMNEILPGSGQPSMLDRATTSLTAARAEARAENARIDNLQQQRRARENQVRTGAQTRRNARRNITPPTGDQQRSTAEAETQSGSSSPGTDNLPDRVDVPTISVAVSYRMKQIRRTGKYTIDLNKYTESVKSMPFAYNPGNVKEQCDDCFHEVNLDDDLMKQREVNASLGGINSVDFEYINFVNVIMKKTHQNGQETVNEIKIDKSKFNADGNLFRMVYGWKGDANRDEWLAYDYRTMWSYIGGYSEETDWASTEFGSIALSPTVIKKPVYIEIDEDFILDENVRGIEIKFYSKLGEKEEIKSINLKTQKDELSKTVELLMPVSNDDFEYDVTYFLKGKDPVSSERKSTNYGRIDIDRFL